MKTTYLDAKKLYQCGKVEESFTLALLDEGINKSITIQQWIDFVSSKIENKSALPVAFYS